MAQDTCVCVAQDDSRWCTQQEPEYLPPRRPRPSAWEKWAPTKWDPAGLGILGFRVKILAWRLLHVISPLGGIFIVKGPVLCTSPWFNTLINRKPMWECHMTLMLAFSLTNTESLSQLQRLLVTAGQAAPPQSNISHPRRDHQLTQHRGIKRLPPLQFVLWCLHVQFLPPPTPQGQPWKWCKNHGLGEEFGTKNQRSQN